MAHEIGCNVHTVDICWAFGGYTAGTPDIILSRKEVSSVLPAGEFLIANKGYYGDPDKIITPKNNDYSDTFNYKHKLMMGRHEEINKRVKDFKCMSDTWRHSWESHVRAFYAFINLTQIKLENGELMPPSYMYTQRER